MRTINKTLLLFIATFFTLACNSTANNSAKESSTTNSSVETVLVSEENTESEGKVIHLTTEEFKQKVFNYEANQEWKYEGSVPCIVDFYADWCGPCKRIAPVLDELAKEYDGKVLIYKVNTDKERQLASAFGISSIPLILFIPVDGKPQAAQGAIPKTTFVQAINDVLLKNDGEI